MLIIILFYADNYVMACIKTIQFYLKIKTNIFCFTEFFIDGLGSLHVGSCDDVIVNHATKIKLPWGQSESDKTYAKFRYPPASSDAAHTKNGLLYFKNRFQCLTHN